MIIIPKGTDSGYEWPVYTASGVPVDLTNWTGIAQIRALNTNKLLHEFSTANQTMILSVGKVTITWSNEETSTWVWKQANIGVEIVSPIGKRGRLVQDIVTLSEEFVI